MTFLSLSPAQRSAVPLFLYLFVLAIFSVITFPIRALFITETLDGGTFENGLTFAIPAIISIFLTPKIGSFSDGISDRRKIISFGLVWLALGVFVVGLAPTSWVMVVACALAFPMMSSVHAQFFAWAKEREIARFGDDAANSAQLRIGYVAGWVAGPAIAGVLLASGLAYRQMFMLQGLGFLIFALLIYLFASAKKKAVAQKTDVFRWRDWSSVPQSLRSITLFVAFVLAGDIVRLANLALFMAENISTQASDLALIFSATPIVEMPATIIFIRLAKQFSEKSILLIGLCAAIAYFALSPFAQNFEQLFLLQAVFGLVPAAALGIGINYAQACAPDRLGFATSFVIAGQSMAIVIGGTLATIGGLYLSVEAIYALPLVFSGFAFLAWLKLSNT